MAPTAVPADVPTPRRSQKWMVENVLVLGSTVTVSLFYHSTASVSVTLGGASEARRDNKTPVLGSIFEDVAPGEYPIVIKDVMGNVEAASVTVESHPSSTSYFPSG